MRKKVSVIGAGNVGASAAERIALRRLADVVLVDIVEGLPQGKALGVSAENPHAFVLGGRGDTMVPLPRYSTVAGIPITELLSPEKIAAIVQRAGDGGIEVVNLLKSGSAYYAPASSIVAMVEAILLDKHLILPCAIYLQGEYGYRDIFVGVPARLGAAGLEQVVEIRLTPEEKTALDRSAEAVRELVVKLRV